MLLSYGIERIVMPSEEDAVRYTSECWDKGFNCAESALRGVCHSMGIELPEVALRMSTPFGGGVGRCEDLCGALSGGVMGIGAALGRSGNNGDKVASYDAAKMLYEQFVRTFGSSLCLELNHGEFKSREHVVRCKNFTTETVRMAYRILNSRQDTKERGLRQFFRV
jgi:C_GCAxxG_C_C family probable redox protein